jgi:hypothetical protein
VDPEVLVAAQRGEQRVRYPADPTWIVAPSGTRSATAAAIAFVALVGGDRRDLDERVVRPAPARELGLVDWLRPKVRGICS